MSVATTSDDSQALLLLCSGLGLGSREDAPKPLSRTEWNNLEKALDSSEFRRPGALLGIDAGRVQSTLGIPGELARRIDALLSRGAQAAIERERLESLGIWVLTRIDERYPARLTDKLRRDAPPVLFGAGPIDLVKRPAVAIVGSREIDDAGASFARSLGELCAAAKVTVVSGAARGADRTAMQGALERGGAAVGVLAESLEQILKQRDVRTAVLESSLTLLTPMHPAVRFTVGAAMGRNKLIYAMADFAVVVSTGLEEGGTWSGAVENLKARWTPLFVRAGSSAPDGNRRLIERGGGAVTLDQLRDDPIAWLGSASRAAVEPAPTLVREAPASYAGPPDSDASDLFPEVWSRLERYLRQPRTEAEVASAFALERGQARAWLGRAVREGLAKKTERPIRYVRESKPSNGQPDLLDPPKATDP